MRSLQVASIRQILIKSNQHVEDLPERIAWHSGVR
jgi:hypothetical protein